MAIDKQIEIAINEAVMDSKEPAQVAQKLIKWLENVMEGSENPLDEGSYARHLDLIYEAMHSDEEEEEA